MKYVAQIDLGEQELTLTRMARIVDSEFAENMHFKRVTLTDLKQTQSGKFPLIIDNSYLTDFLKEAKMSIASFT